MNGRRYKRAFLVTGIFGIVLVMHYSRMGYSFWSTVGMSFYALQAVSYLIDVYKGNMVSERNLLHYALYIAFFPKFLSGPIERADDFLRQITQMGNRLSERSVKHAFVMLVWGYFEKMVVADHAKLIVDKIFSEYWTQHGGILVLGIVLYGVQLYADFDGYSNMALGIAELFGFRLTRNFRRPYFAKSIGEFWHRWHISLSSWLRDYIYIPLGGNRKGKLIQYGNLLITFGVSGIWHGYGMKYLVWGMLHGVYQVLGKLLRSPKNRIAGTLHIRRNGLLLRVLKSVGVFAMADLAWILFRAESFKEALRYGYYLIVNFIPNPILNTNMMRLEIDLSIGVTLLFGIALLIAGDVICEKYERDDLYLDFERMPTVVRWGSSMGLICLIVCAVLQRYGMDVAGFLYADF